MTGEEIERLAIKIFGKEKQMLVCVEELSELQKEIIKKFRGFQNESNIAEEIADCEIVLEQMKMIFENSHEVETYKAGKLERLQKILEKEIRKV